MLRRGLNVVLVSAAASALAACNLAPHYRPPLVTVPKTYQQQGVWEAARPADNLSRGDWWARFSDPTLDGLEKRIETANPDLAGAVARYDQARDYAKEAKADLYPTISAGGVASDNRQSLNRPLRAPNTPQPNYYGDQSVSVTGNYEFDFWGKIRNMVASRKAMAQASDADLATMRLSLQASACHRLFPAAGP